jgi:hypothetical protein
MGIHVVVVIECAGFCDYLKFGLEISERLGVGT